jgi:hypothetical protein
MALSKSILEPNGTTPTYHDITQMNYSLLQNNCSLEVLSWYNQAAFAANVGNSKINGVVPKNDWRYNYRLIIAGITSYNCLSLNIPQLSGPALTFHIITDLTYNLFSNQVSCIVKSYNDEIAFKNNPSYPRLTSGPFVVKMGTNTTSSFSKNPTPSISVFTYIPGEDLFLQFCQWLIVNIPMFKTATIITTSLVGGQSQDKSFTYQSGVDIFLQFYNWLITNETEWNSATIVA